MLPNAQLQLVPACDIGSILKESLWLISGSLWLSLADLFAYKVLAWLTRPLLSSQPRYRAATLYAGLSLSECMSGKSKKLL